MEDINDLRSRLAQEEAQLADAHKQIDNAHKAIAELRSRCEALEKRVELLREYIAVVESGDQGAAPPEALPPALAPASSPPARPPPVGSAPPAGSLPAWMSPGATADRPAQSAAGALSFKAGIDEQQLADEILPRAGSFENALLLLLAHYNKKSLTPQSIVKAFRSMEYAPDVPATPESVETQLEQRPDFFAHAGRNGFVLTKAGREEAQRILNQLSL